MTSMEKHVAEYEREEIALRHAAAAAAVTRREEFTGVPARISIAHAVFVVTTTV